MKPILSSRRTAWVLAALVLPAAPALAGPAFDRCAAEASSQYEVGFESIGMETWEIDAPAAIKACSEALKEEPDSAQAKGWLARAYFADGDTAKAVPLFEEAAEGGHVVALAIFGDMLITMRYCRTLFDEAAAQEFAALYLSCLEGLSLQKRRGVPRQPQREAEATTSPAD